MPDSPDALDRETLAARDVISALQLSTHAVTDEATGRYYDLKSDAVDLEDYVGQRVTVHGGLLASPAIAGVGVERCPDLDVTRVEPAAPVDPVDPAPVDPAPVVDVDGNGSVDASDGAKTLPATGGALPIAGLLGALLVGGGLLARRIAR